jgi:UDP-sugar diphosphatase
MKLGLGGGIDDEKIELVFIKRSEILDFIYDESKIKAPNLQFSILWWIITKNPK